jgi:hypothetical protein
MHRSLLTAGFCLLCAIAMAQKTEWHAHANTGLFFFSGNAAEKTQTVYHSMGPNSSTILSREYGKKPGLSIAAGGAIQRITRGKWLMGADLGFQLLSASSDIDSVEIMPTLGGINGKMKADGESKFKGACIAVSPFIGKRFGDFSITAGPEFALFLSSSEEVKYKLNNSDQVNQRKNDDLNHPGMDFRFRFALSWNIKRFVVSASYTKGLTNFYKEYVGANPEAYSNMAGVGVSYLLGQ